MNYTLNYNSDRGLYISTGTKTEDKILLRSHSIEHERMKSFTIQEKEFKVSVWSNFACAYYMYATIYYKGKQLLDFNPQKIFVLNHRELSRFYVPATMGRDKAWEMMFELITDVFNNREIYYQYKEPQISSYFNTLLETLTAKEVNVWGSWDINCRPTKWAKPLLSFSLFSNNLQELLQTIENDNDFYAQYKKDIILLCETFISKLKFLFNDINFYDKKGEITDKERFIKTFDMIHNYLENQGESLLFMSTCLARP